MPRKCDAFSRNRALFMLVLTFYTKTVIYPVQTVYRRHTWQRSK
jgi:hypothetical protein